MSFGPEQPSTFGESLDRCMSNNDEDLVFRLLKRAEIRRQIKGRKSVQEGKPDRIADLLEEAAARIQELEEKYGNQPA